VFCSKQ